MTASCYWQFSPECSYAPCNCFARTICTNAMMHPIVSISMGWIFSTNGTDLISFISIRGGIIEDEDGGVVTESLHKPSQEKKNPQFSGNTIQSRSFNLLEETLAAGKAITFMCAWPEGDIFSGIAQIERLYPVCKALKMVQFAWKKIPKMELNAHVTQRIWQKLKTYLF